MRAGTHCGHRALPRASRLVGRSLPGPQAQRAPLPASSHARVRPAQLRTCSSYTRMPAPHPTHHAKVWYSPMPRHTHHSQVLDQLLDRTHLALGAPPPFPPLGVGYEVVHHASSCGMLKDISNEEAAA